MAWTAVAVTVGNPTKASELNNVQGNATWLQGKADVEHDFDTSTGGGKHKNVTPIADSTYDLGTATYRFQICYVDKIGDQGQTLIIDTAGTRWETVTLAHGMTDLLVTDQYASIAPSSTSSGGLVVYGVSGVATLQGVQLTGIIGNADPTDTVAAVQIYGGKKNGTTWQALGAGETVYQLTNYTTNLVTVLGSGFVGFGTVTPTTLIDARGGTVSISEAGVTHGMTSIAATNTCAYLKALSATAGGLELTALSDTDASAIYIRGIIGSADPGDTTSAIQLIGGRLSGTSWDVLAAAERVLTILNGTTTLVTVNGAGGLGLVGTYLAPLWFGTTKCMWNDGTGNFRTNSTAPTSALDGNLLAEA